MLEKAILFARDTSLPPPTLVGALEKGGFEAVLASSEAELVQRVAWFSPECIVVLSSSAMDSAVLGLADQVRRIDHLCPLVILTSSLSVDGAICAMRAGASDLLEQSAPVEEIVATLKSLDVRYHQGQIRQSVDNELIGCQKMVGSGTAMIRIRSQLSQLGATDANVLITGESGTGKELAAELIHRNSRRRSRPFVAINCAALPDTLLESELFGYERGAFTGANVSRDGKLQYAAGGTLFLDEIGDMSLAAQAKILRAVDGKVIQRLGSNVDTPVQVRLLAATNQNLEEMTQEKKFRRDLYYRLNVVRLVLPPLRERLEDIPELVDQVVRELSAQHREPPRRVESDVVRRFQRYSWPGNIRELRNVLESILVFSSSRSISLGDIPIEIRHSLRSSTPLYGDERTKILSALTSASWNRNKAATALRCSRMTLYRKMTKYAIPAHEREM
jgi:DNA-binding NtrC family response regulator